MKSPWVNAPGLFLLLMDQSGRDRQPSLLNFMKKKLDKGWQNGYNILVGSSKIASFLTFGSDLNVIVRL